jgi:leucyl/phenylalanyl-tRNA--protein transferase
MGIFPMGEQDGSVGWYESSPRAILPIELPTSRLHIPRSLSQSLKKNPFELRIDTHFDNVIKACAARDSTWINDLIVNAYLDLFNRGYAHSIETWQENKLVGGLYGVAYAGAFFGESMFHTVDNASKFAVVKLYELLKKNNYVLFDIQMMTPLFETLGAINITKKDYQDILERAMKLPRKFRF